MGGKQIIKIYEYIRILNKIKKTTPLELREVTLLLSKEEIDEMIVFLNKVKILHNSIRDSTYLIHTHFSDVIKKIQMVLI